MDEACLTWKHAKHTHPGAVLLSASFEGTLMAAHRHRQAWGGCTQESARSATVQTSPQEKLPPDHGDVEVFSILVDVGVRN